MGAGLRCNWGTGDGHSSKKAPCHNTYYMDKAGVIVLLSNLPLSNTCWPKLLPSQPPFWIGHSLTIHIKELLHLTMILPISTSPCKPELTFYTASFISKLLSQWSPACFWVGWVYIFNKQIIFKMFGPQQGHSSPYEPYPASRISTMLWGWCSFIWKVYETHAIYLIISQWLTVTYGKWHILSCASSEIYQLKSLLANKLFIKALFFWFSGTYSLATEMQVQYTLRDNK